MGGMGKILGKLPPEFAGFHRLLREEAAVFGSFWMRAVRLREPLPWHGALTNYPHIRSRLSEKPLQDIRLGVVAQVASKADLYRDGSAVVVGGRSRASTSFSS